MATDYDSGVGEVHAALSDERYWLARLARSGADEARLDAMTVGSDGGIDVVTTQVLRSDRLPSVVSQFHRGDLEIRREETWSPLQGPRADATVSGGIAGAPVSLAGTVELSGDDERCTLALRADVEVRVPLVGRKLENFIGNQLRELLVAEQRFTTAWIAGEC